MWTPGLKPGATGLTVGMGNSAAAQGKLGGKGKGKDPYGGYGPSWAASSWSAPGWSSGPYDYAKKEKDVKKEKEDAAFARWQEKHAGPIAPVDWLIIPSTSKHIQAGFSAIMPAMEFTKEKEIFSDAHKVLQDFFCKGEEYTMINTIMDFEYDHDMTEYPEVHAAWKAQGGFENGVTIATCLQAGQWGAGFGSKEKSARAAKLALAVALALTLDGSEFTRVGTDYPAFAELCYAAQKTHPLVLAAAQGAAATQAAASAVTSASSTASALLGPQ